MTLTELWRNSPDELRRKHIQQIIAFAGGGRLLDGSPAAQEFRAFLGLLEYEDLERYAEQCLEGGFQDSGLALQDLVNDLGRRLKFEVTDGRYRGTSKEVGFDGLWLSTAGHAFVVEVKTTDAYRVDLNQLASYRKKLVASDRIAETDSSVLIVVGRQDTGDLEAQIRGSRHAWDVRLISVHALLQLVAVKEDVEDPQVLHRIHQILVPREFTRLDAIVDVLFSTTEDLKEEGPDVVEEAEDDGEKKFTPVAFHRACVDRIADELGVSFVKQSRASFHSPDDSQRLVCAVSREHTRLGHPSYWFAIHPHQRAFLSESQRAFVAFGCGSPDLVLLIPFDDFEPWLDGLNTTEKGDRTYWHVPIIHDGSSFTLLRRRGIDNVDLSGYLLPMESRSQAAD